PVYSSSDAGAADNRGRAARIMVVEDDHLVAMDVEATLNEAGFQVVAIAGSAEEAFAIGLAERPDIAIMDIGLVGDRDGVDAAIQLCREINVRCIFATAYHDLVTRKRAEAAAPLGWLAKPYQPEALVRAVRRALVELGATS